MSRYADSHRGRFGLEPICRALGVSAAADYHRRIGSRSARVSDEQLQITQHVMLRCLRQPRIAAT